MDANEYQRRARETAVYPTAQAIAYPVVGMANEAGEALGIVKKSMRGDFDLLRADDLPAMLPHTRKLMKELGDVQWYVAMAAEDLGLTLSELMEYNLGKLSDRARRGVIQGDGDDR